MSIHSNTWLCKFLAARELEGPDGRPLYAYRCGNQEFESLIGVLSANHPFSAGDEATIRAFVLYASEWWQRRYDGRQWTWEPLLESVGWHWIQYSDLYAPVKRAWTWWGVDLVRLPTSVRYLGTFACQGGLPLALVSDTDNRITRYLRAVLKHTAAYRQFVDDSIELARDQQRLLRPPTLRRDYVFRLAADLIEAVLDLESDVQGDDPMQSLDEARPDWRDAMPLDLEDERAKDLLTGLLREAQRSSAGRAENFRLERFLLDSGDGWRFGARVRLPSNIPADSLARLLRVPAVTLPPRLQVNVQGNRIRPIGFYAAQSEHFLLLRSQQPPSTKIWDVDAASEVRLQFQSGAVVGQPIVPDRGDALGDLPWTFREDQEEYIFLGEGSVSNRSAELVVIVPEDYADKCSHTEDATLIPSLNRVLWRVTEPTAIDTTNGRCVIRPSSGHQAEERDYRIAGERDYSLDCDWPIYRNVPKLHIVMADRAPRSVPAKEVAWRQAAGEWRQKPETDVFGLWELRHVRGGELLFFGRVGILPPQFDVSLEFGADMSEGCILLHGVEDVKVAIDETNVEGTAQTEGDTVRVHVSAHDRGEVPVFVRLRLHWQGCSDLIVRARFPGQGARFLRDGKTLDTRDLAVGNMYGVRATALSPDNAQCFYIEGSLEAPNLSDLHKIAYFRQALVKDGVTHELPLIDLRLKIAQLLAASPSSEATVRLRILDKSQEEYDKITVRRFEAELDHDASMSYISISDGIQNDYGAVVSCSALPLAHPGDEATPLSLITYENDFHGAVLPQDFNMNEPWLVVVRHDERMLIRPVTIGGRSDDITGVMDAVPIPLSEAVSVADPELRQQCIEASFDSLLVDEDTSVTEKEWAFLNDTLLRVSDLPITEIDLLTILSRNPRLMIRCLFRMEKSHRQFLWQFEDELPFSWLLIRREIWWKEAKTAFNRLRDQLSGVVDGDHDQIASEHISLVLDEGADLLPALSTVATDIALRLKGSSLPTSLVQSVINERDKRTPKQITLRASMDDWPQGYGRREWAQELKLALEKLPIWQHRYEHRARQPIFDTPVAAAFCCFFAQPTPRTEFLVKRIRTLDPDWFDWAYSAAWYRFAHKVDNR